MQKTSLRRISQNDPNETIPKRKTRHDDGFRYITASDNLNLAGVALA